MKKHPVLFTIALAIAVTTIILGVYYLIPHVYHPFVVLAHPFQLINNPPTVNYNAHKKYTAVFFAAAALALMCAYFLRQQKFRYIS